MAEDYTGNYLDGESLPVPLSMYRKNSILVGVTDGEPKEVNASEGDVGQALGIDEDGNLGFVDVSGGGGGGTGLTPVISTSFESIADRYATNPGNDSVIEVTTNGLMLSNPQDSPPATATLTVDTALPLNFDNDMELVVIGGIPAASPNTNQISAWFGLGATATLGQSGTNLMGIRINTMLDTATAVVSTSGGVRSTLELGSSSSTAMYKMTKLGEVITVSVDGDVRGEITTNIPDGNVATVKLVASLPGDTAESQVLVQFLSVATRI